MIAQTATEPVHSDALTVAQHGHSNVKRVLEPSIGEARPQVRGKFLFVGNRKLWIHGMTYGAFRPDANGHEFHDHQLVDRDFAQMAEIGINTVRIPHTTPPRSLLDAAMRHGLRVMVGLSAEQYVGYLIDRTGAPDIEEVLRAKVRSCVGHPALLCYSIGNEIPASMARWLGRHRLERYLERLFGVIKAEDAQGLVTYVNYPTTEYLDLPFLDFVCFNIYLESQDRFAAYLARLQNVAGNRPLVVTEIGLDSLRNGEETQAHTLDWQIRTSFLAGCAGAVIFSWTDEWYRGDDVVDDWAFGITDHDRRRKPSLSAVQDAFAEVPFGAIKKWPRISVVVCSYNGARTIRDTLEGLRNLDYPDFEVIVVDDGSTDSTPSIAQDYDVRLISTENRGLSNARNTGLEAATGEIVTYIDDDAYPDPHWLTFLAVTFMNSDHVGVGGPNLAPPDDGPIADCVANAPGNPSHVLLADDVAEHIPGCNMAFRKDALQAINGFDPRFRSAGDDVDICWRLQERGWTLGFSHGAMNWHHRRNSIRMFWKQQLGYGRAEALLEEKWPAKFKASGQMCWSGRLYGKGLTRVLLARSRIYQGVWGSAPFQSLYQPSPGVISSLPLMPEWHLLIVCLAGLSALSAIWTPLLIFLPLFAAALAASLIQAGLSAANAKFQTEPLSSSGRLKLRALTAYLHLIQPLARLVGRLRHGLTPWRRRCAVVAAFPKRRSLKIWHEQWQAPEERLTSIEAKLHDQGAVVVRGGDYDRWDLEIRGGLFGSVRAQMAVEEHGAGKQLVRYRHLPKISSLGLGLIIVPSFLSIAAAIDQAWIPSAVFGTVALGFAIRAIGDCAAAAGSWGAALKNMGGMEV